MKESDYKIGETKVKIMSLILCEDNIINLYDVCNKIFFDKPQCFYTKCEIKNKNSKF